MDILDDMGGVNYQQKFFLKVNYSFNFRLFYSVRLKMLSRRILASVLKYSFIFPICPHQRRPPPPLYFTLQHSPSLTKNSLTG